VNYVDPQWSMGWGGKLEPEIAWGAPEGSAGELFEVFGIYTFFGDNGYPKITKEIVHHSLLRANYLPSFNGRNPEMPPVFSSNSFTPEAAADLLAIPNSRKNNIGFDYARFEQMRPDGHARHSGIPHPFAHAKLVQAICDNWDDLSFLTENQHSAIRPILTRDGRIFASDYPQDQVDEESWESTMRRNADYHLRLDIRNFFPSIYTHSLNWVPFGVEGGKSGLTDITHPAAKHFSKDLDVVARLGNRTQTIGLVVGPGTSNLLAEYLLSAVDKSMEVDFGNRFRRHVDDYEFFAETKDDADNFQRKLEIELRQFELYLNPTKTKLTPLTEPLDPLWMVKAKSWRLDGSTSIQSLRAYWDAILLDFKDHGQHVALRWAMGSILKAASDSQAKSWSVSFLVDQLRHFSYLAPYLRIVISDEGLLSSKDLVCLEQVFLQRFERLYTDSRLWLLTVLGLNRSISREVISTVLEKGDSITQCLLYEFHVTSPRLILNRINSSNLSHHSQDQNWLANYQMFIGGDGKPDPEGYFEALHSRNVDFISRAHIAPF